VLKFVRRVFFKELSVRKLPGLSVFVSGWSEPASGPSELPSELSELTPGLSDLSSGLRELAAGLSYLDLFAGGLVHHLPVLR
jgi:X-X-X-Leu-X-X-Gly heptad repeat protein